MFTVEPEVMKQFSFVPKGVTNPEELKSSARFLRHAKNLIATVSNAVDNLDDMEDLSKTLNNLGRRHKKYKTKTEYFPIVGRSLTHAISTATGDAFTPETAAAFSQFFAMITFYTNEGLMEEA
uniref:Globin Ngb n=1 Tax=Platynereis dumerilii TaxID=6359 RepID=A0A7T8CM07_PLADU|nr:globin Ngb [Platynereis dumerilii]